MSVQVYECMLILDAHRYARDATGVSKLIDQFVEKYGGEMLVSRLWEERRLAYTINGQRKGTYWLSYFKLESSNLPQLERECQLTDGILRSLTLKVDPRIADALVEHARAGATAKAAPAAEPATAAALGAAAKPAAKATDDDSDGSEAVKPAPAAVRKEAAAGS